MLLQLRPGCRLLPLGLHRCAASRVALASLPLPQQPGSYLRCRCHVPVPAASWLRRKGARSLPQLKINLRDGKSRLLALGGLGRARPKTKVFLANCRCANGKRFHLVTVKIPESELLTLLQVQLKERKQVADKLAQT